MALTPKARRFLAAERSDQKKGLAPVKGPAKPRRPRKPLGAPAIPKPSMLGATPMPRPPGLGVTPPAATPTLGATLGAMRPGGMPGIPPIRTPGPLGR